MNRRAVYAIAALAVAAIVVAVVAFVRHGATAVADAPPPPPGPNVALARVAIGTYDAHLDAQGRVGAPAGSDAKLAFAGSGIVKSIDVRVGERVAAGQRLAALDSAGLAIDAQQARSDALAARASFGGGSVPSQALASARARLASAQDRLRALERGDASAQSDRAAATATLVQAQSKLAADQRALQRAQTLFAGGVLAAKDVEAARAQIMSDEADVDASRAKAASAAAGVGAAFVQARADLAQARSDERTAQAQVTVVGAQASSAEARATAAARNVDLAVLRSPLDGVVTAILKHAGEPADPTSPAIVVGQQSSGVVTLVLAADAARRVHAGDSVDLRVSARSGQTSGTVRDVVPSVDPGTQTAVLTVDGAPRGAVPGDAVTAVVHTGRRRGIVIPTSAVVEDPQSGKTLVFVRGRQKDGSDGFSPREVEIAAGDEDTTLVASGLRPGERIASQGAFDLLAPAGGGD